MAAALVGEQLVSRRPSTTSSRSGNRTIQTTGNASVAPTGAGGVLLTAAAAGPGQMIATATTTTGPAADLASVARARTLTVGQVRRQVHRAGLVKLKLGLNSKGRLLLRLRGKLRIEVVLTFKPKHGHKTVTHVSVTLVRRHHR